jgi:hypothetical protein
MEVYLCICFACYVVFWHLDREAAEKLAWEKELFVPTSEIITEEWILSLSPEDRRALSYLYND